MPRPRRDSEILPAKERLENAFWTLLADRPFGKITVTDMVAAKHHLLQKSTITGVYAIACDTNNDGNISITDFIQLKAHILQKSQIQAN